MTQFRDLLLDVVNVIDDVLVGWVFKRRGPAFIYWATKPDQWDEFMNDLDVVRYRIVYRNDDGTINRHWMDTYSSDNADKMVIYLNQLIPIDAHKVWAEIASPPYHITP